MNINKKRFIVFLCMCLIFSLLSTVYAATDAPIIPPSYSNRENLVYRGNLDARTVIDAYIPQGTGVYYTVSPPSIYNVDINLSSGSSQFAIETNSSTGGVQFQKIWWDARFPLQHYSQSSWWKMGKTTLVIFNESYDASFYGTINFPAYTG